MLASFWTHLGLIFHNGLILASSWPHLGLILAPTLLEPKWLRSKFESKRVTDVSMPSTGASNGTAAPDGAAEAR